MSNTLAIYACGGFGINVLSEMVNIPENVSGFPKVKRYVFDTSTSNLRKSNVEDKVDETFIVPNVDGGGKDQKYAYEKMLPHIDEVVSTMTPQDTNIVVFSLSGASGAIGGPLIARELLNRGKTVIIITVGSSENEREAVNSYRSIGRLQQIADKTSRPTLAAIHWMETNDDWQRVNTGVAKEIRAIALMSGGEVHGLDRKDISNFTNYHKVTPISAQLTQLHTYVVYTDDKTEPAYPEAAIAVLSLKAEDASPVPLLDQPYGCAGTLPESMFKVSKDAPYSVHFVATNTTLATTVKRAQELMEKKQAASKALASVEVIRVDTGDDDFCL